MKVSCQLRIGYDGRAAKRFNVPHAWLSCGKSVSQYTH